MPLPQQLAPTSHVTDERIAALYAGLSARVASELRKDPPHCSQENLRMSAADRANEGPVVLLAF